MPHCGQARGLAATRRWRCTLSVGRPDAVGRFAPSMRRPWGGDVTLEFCPEAFHVWQMAGPGVPESEEALGSLTRFVRGRWSKPD